MKFGITNKGFRRLAQGYAQYTDEDLARGELILSAMGYAMEGMSEEDLIRILDSNPNYLELTPQLDVSGQWIHTLRETHLGSIQYEIEDLINSNREICVTSAEAGAYWSIEYMRRFAVVFEGVCRVLWNADVYSYFDEERGQLVKSLDKGVEFIGEVTEGWLVPSEARAVGIQVNWEGIRKDYSELDSVSAKLQSISEALGVPLIEDVDESKEVVDIEVIPSGEASSYTCEV
jgi:hypothetical protein